MTNHLTGGPPVSSSHIAGLVCALNNNSSDSFLARNALPLHCPDGAVGVAVAARDRG